MLNDKLWFAYEVTAGPAVESGSKGCGLLAVTRTASLLLMIWWSGQPSGELVGIGVEPWTRVAAELPTLNHVAQQLWWGKARTQLLFQIVGNPEPDIKANNTGESQWADGVLIPQDQGVIDVFCGCNTFFNHPNGF